MRPQQVTVGPLASASANALATSQKAAASGAQLIVLDGTLTDAAATAVCASQTPAGSGALTINGTMASGGVAYFGQNRPVYITSAGNDSGRTFTIVGTYAPPGGPVASVYQTATVTGANTSKVSTTALFNTVTSVTISGAAAGAVTVGMGGIATLDTPRRILWTPAGADSGITATFTGTNYANEVITETLTGVNNPSTTYTALDYKTVTSISLSGAAASTFTFGTNGVASSPWVKFDSYTGAAQVAIQITVSGTVNYTVQQTLDDPNLVTNSGVNGVPQFNGITPATMTWVNSSDTNAVGATSTIQTNYAMAPVYARVLLNSGTGTVKGTFVQAYQY